MSGVSVSNLAETFGLGENPSGNAYCSARGLATVGAAMANRGVFKGTKVRRPCSLQSDTCVRQVLSDKGWAALHDDIKKDVLLGSAMIIDYRIPSYISQGGLLVYTDK